MSTHPILVKFDNITIKYEIVTSPTEESELVFLHLEYDGEVDEKGFGDLYDTFGEILEHFDKLDVPCVFCLIKADRDRRIRLVKSLGFVEEEKIDDMILFKAETF